MQGKLRIENLAPVSDLKTNILSVNRLRKIGCHTVFEENPIFPEEDIVLIIKRTSGQTILRDIQKKFGLCEILPEPQ